MEKFIIIFYYIIYYFIIIILFSIYCNLIRIRFVKESDTDITNGKLYTKSNKLNDKKK